MQQSNEITPSIELDNRCYFVSCIDPYFSFWKWRIVRVSRHAPIVLRSYDDYTVINALMDLRNEQGESNFYVGTRKQILEKFRTEYEVPGLNNDPTVLFDNARNFSDICNDITLAFNNSWIQASPKIIHVFNSWLQAEVARGRFSFMGIQLTDVEVERVDAIFANRNQIPADCHPRDFLKVYRQVLIKRALHRGETDAGVPDEQHLAADLMKDILAEHCGLDQFNSYVDVKSLAKKTAAAHRHRPEREVDARMRDVTKAVKARIQNEVRIASACGTKGVICKTFDDKELGSELTKKVQMPRSAGRQAQLVDRRSTFQDLYDQMKAADLIPAWLTVADFNAYGYVNNSYEAFKQTVEDRASPLPLKQFLDGILLHGPYYSINGHTTVSAVVTNVLSDLTSELNNPVVFVEEAVWEESCLLSPAVIQHLFQLTTEQIVTASAIGQEFFVNVATPDNEFLKLRVVGYSGGSEENQWSINTFLPNDIKVGSALVSVNHEARSKLVPPPMFRPKPTPSPKLWDEDLPSNPVKPEDIAVVETAV